MGFLRLLINNYMISMVSSLIPKIFIIKLVLIFLIFGWLVVLTFHEYKYNQVDSNQVDSQRDVFKLVDDCLSKFEPRKASGLKELTDRQTNCVNFIRNKSILVTENIRLSAFSKQQEIGQIMLWMVVVITISGVLLSAFQLYVGYMLANAGLPTSGNGETIVSTMSIEKGKISIQSSIAGVIILSISLIFFIVYVTRVYPINEINTDIFHKNYEKLDLQVTKDKIPMDLSPAHADKNSNPQNIN